MSDQSTSTVGNIATEAVTDIVEMHPDIASLKFLLGTWSGTGTGEYPTIPAFAYNETITFSHTGKPYLLYTQATTHAEDGRALHAETGYWRLPTTEHMEILLAHPTGFAEVLEGTFDKHADRGGVVDVKSTSVGRTKTSKEVKQTERVFTIDLTGAVPSLTYTVSMRGVGVPMRSHLTATLTRQT